ncbi:subtilisin-like protease SBT5.3 [Nymphaea colorata]|nr:subtilisin-like protease SBT5.3 [Nymphaea colorata]
MKGRTVNFELPLFFVLFFFLIVRSSYGAKKSYVVYLGAHSHVPDSINSDLVADSHHELLGTFLGSKEEAKESIFYSYTNHINGFAANLEEEQASDLAEHPSVVAVFPNKGYKLHTTHSWDFLGLEDGGQPLPDSIWEQTNYGDDMIIGNIDTGVWPESQSFNDEGLGPIPTKWKGLCQNETDTNGIRCNRKLIGARYHNKGYMAAVGASGSPADYISPRDRHGHGTHTLSTAGGSPVLDASMFGLAKGTAKGGAPKARVAAYKVCWDQTASGSCFFADVLAAFDAAIGDGVDVISISIGGELEDYLKDASAIGSFHAISRGIPVTISAGNGGPGLGSVTNVAPWLFTVAAATSGRDFPASVSLGNGQTLKGQSLSSTSLLKNFYPLLRGSDAAISKEYAHLAAYCGDSLLDPEKANGKILACLGGKINPIIQGTGVQLAGAVGMILCNDPDAGFDGSLELTIPATYISTADCKQLFDYINSTESPVAYIEPPSTELSRKPSPVMASFSGQGPNQLNPDILKPDITAPGVNILSAFTEAVSDIIYSFENRMVQFKILSGTSMASPHVAGVVGLLRKAHPNWSPAAIKSAIMTTATVLDNLNEPIKNASMKAATSFNYGAGHLNPNRAMDPGLVYDTTVTDYLNFFCAIGYNQSSIFAISGQNYSCPCQVIKVSDLNYPSITITNLTGVATVSRTLKNVGTPGTYIVNVQSPPGIAISVQPECLKFEEVDQENEFTVTVETNSGSPHGYAFGSLSWSDGEHNVRSPIVIEIVSS